MPQVYRRHTDHTTNPRPAPSHRASSSSSSALEPTDADDSIVISDLVRTGEASRLRRRGAMRLEHPRAAILMPPPIPVPVSNTRTAVPTPAPASLAERAPTPPWTTIYPSGDEEYAVGDAWREWSADAGGEGDEAGTVAEPREEQGFMLFCGGGEGDTLDSASEAAAATAIGPGASFVPSALPVTTLSAGVTDSSSARGRTGPGHGRRTNGCGTVVHMRAFPQRSRGVWVGKEDATDVVVGLDSAYCERSVIARVMKSACGCVREAIGCAVCGNMLGTRYLPCQAASEGIFARHPSSNPAEQHKPLVPSGPSYWHCRNSSPSTQSASSSLSGEGASSTFYVYTFFAAHVSPSPAYAFPAQPQPPREEPSALSAYSSQAPAWLPDGPTFRWTSSPRPLSPFPLQVQVQVQSAVALSPSSATSTWSPVFARPRTPPARTSEGTEGGNAPLEPQYTIVPSRPMTPRSEDVTAAPGMTLDPDGVLIDADDLNSPDKTGTETMTWPGR